MSCRASVIIPVYNAEKTLRRCVESLVLGFERRVEVILVNDCSSDNSLEICKELVAEFPNVIYIQNKKNRGVSFTRNQGLAAATGEYILFADSDDWVSERYAEALLKLAEENPNCLPICGQHFIDKVGGATRDYTWGGERGTVHEIPSERFWELSDKFLLQQLWNKIFRRDIIEKHNIRFDETQSMGEDFQFVLDYLKAAQIKQCVVLNEPLYYYIRWNNTSLMSKFGFIDNQPEFDRMTQLAQIVGPNGDARKDAMIAQSKRNYVYHIVRNKNHTKQEKLAAIERIMGDGQASHHYRQQQIQHARENAAQLLRDVKALYPRIKGKLGRNRLQKQIARIKENVNAEGITIISQNCIGGVFYHDMGMQFLSPTINAFIPEPGFVKLVLNLRHYMEQALVMRWEEEYPVGMLDDIEIHFMHYATCQEAKAAWERRKQRINFEKILVVATDRNGFDDYVFDEWKQIPYPKVLFTVNPRYAKEECCILFPQYQDQPFVPDLIPERGFYKDGVLVNTINQLGG